MQTIIVGVDGSAGGDAALEFAAEEARMRNAKLRVVSVWELAPTLIDPPGGDFIKGLRAPADAAVRAAWEYLEASWPDLDRTVEAWEGVPERVLVSLAESADLLVVGDHGHGHLSSFVLGSVSHHVIQHARCPVVVVPHTLSTGSTLAAAG